MTNDVITLTFDADAVQKSSARQDAEHAHSIVCSTLPLVEKSRLVKCARKGRKNKGSYAYLGTRHQSRAQSRFP